MINQVIFYPCNGVLNIILHNIHIHILLLQDGAKGVISADRIVKKFIVILKIKCILQFSVVYHGN